MNTTQRHIDYIKGACHTLSDVRTRAKECKWEYICTDYKNGHQSDTYIYGQYPDGIGAIVVTETNGQIKIRHYINAPQKYLDRASNKTLWDRNYKFIQDKTVDEVMDAVNTLLTFFKKDTSVISREYVSNFIISFINNWSIYHSDDYIPNHQYKTMFIIDEICSRIVGPFIEGKVTEDVKNAIRQNLITKGYDEEDADSQAQQIIEAHSNDIQRAMAINMSYLRRPIMSKEQSYMEAIAKLEQRLIHDIEINQAA